MSRHRNLKHLLDEDDYYDDYDAHGQEDEEIQLKPKPKIAAPVAAKKPAAGSGRGGGAAAAAHKPHSAKPHPAHAAGAAPADPKPPLLPPKSDLIPAKPLSDLTRGLASRPTPASARLGSAVALAPDASPRPAAATTATSPVSFDFSTPSPDMQVSAAQRRTDRQAARVIVPAASKSRPQPPQPQPQPSQQTAPEGAAGEPAPKTKAQQKRDEEDDLADAGKKPLLSLVVVGHVDAGKSTLMGHLLYDLQNVSQKDMHAFERESKDQGKASFKFAWVLDEHAEERSRGVTIDVGMRRFETAHRRVVLLDAPGHKDFVPNMITGASQADAAFLVVPAATGEFESSFSDHSQTREHAVLLFRLGLTRLVVVVNKMDSVGWSQERFEHVKSRVETFLQAETGFESVAFCPVSGLTGENLVKPCSPGNSNAAWCASRGPTLAQLIDELAPAKRPAHKPMRLVVTDAYKSQALGACTVGGKLESGYLRVGDAVLVCPLQELATVKAISVHGESTRRARAGDNCEVGLAGGQAEVLAKIQPGAVLCSPDAPVPVTGLLRARVTALAMLKMPLLNGSQGTLHLHAVEVPATIVRIERILAPKPQERPRLVRRHDTAEVVLRLAWPVCVERVGDSRPLSRLLLRIAGVTVAAGVAIDVSGVPGGD